MLIQLTSHSDTVDSAVANFYSIVAHSFASSTPTEQGTGVVAEGRRYFQTFHWR